MDIVEKIQEEIGFYKKKINDYKNGNIDPDIKGIRAIKGVYLERKVEKYMTRIKIPAGIITLDQFEAVSKIADKYSNGEIHFSTRQDIQFQGVELESTAKIMDEVLELGINTLGAGGNSARNVACSPLSGVDKNEIFDVTAYAIKTSEHLLKDPSTRKLPRKYKVAFSNNNLDTAYATIADLGFVAKIENGKKGFEVYGAGGLGGAPNVALKLENFIEDKDVLYYVQAMKELFEAEGDRQNRNKARIRYIVYRLGENKFKEVFKYHLEKVKKETHLDLFIDDEDKKYEVEADEPSVSSLLVTEQKQKGYYSTFIHSQNGYITTENLNKVLTYIRNLDYEISIRLTNTQGFYLRDIKGKDIDGLLGIISTFAAPLPIENAVTCVGATVCGIGLCNSKGLSSVISSRFSEVSDDIKRMMPKVFISGCHNSCGQHQTGKIGFSGKAVKADGGMIPAYRVSFGGVIEANKTKFGEVKGDIPAKKVPDFLYNLAVLAYESKYESFDKFIEVEWAKVEALIKEFETIDSDSQLYYDFESDIKFLSSK